MNAYELADELDEAVMKLVANDCFFEAQAVEKSANMLRQQADRIAELEKQSEPSYFGLTNDHTWLSCDEKMYNKLKPTHRMKCYTTPQTELNDGGEPVKNATYWKRQHDNLLMKLNVSAIKIAELEKQLDIRTRELIGASLYEHDYKTLMANSEPVAWKSTLQKNWFLPNEDMKTGKYDKQFWIPLYTTPQTKPLSDEEITKIGLDT